MTGRRGWPGVLAQKVYAIALCHTLFPFDTSDFVYYSVCLCEFTNLGWLAGKTYNLININVPVHFKGDRDDLDGDLVLVMFENHADPIVGNRDTIGYSKIYYIL